MPKVISVHEATYDRLQSLGKGFRSDPLGTPDKVIQMLLDNYEEENPPPDDPYGTCVSSIKKQLTWAMTLDGGMSEGEYENLKEFEEYVRRLDNS